jgi:iron complex outermembrane recepter protein
VGETTANAEQFRRAAAGIAMLGMALTAAAQQDADTVVKLEKIEITGSRIARIDGESGLPVQIITREEMLDGGVQTMQDLLQRISANQSYGGFNELQGINNLVVGMTAASLRGLGTERTLVLMNGRRLAPYALAGGQGVDLSAIPASAIERVEVLKDGASAIYGSDAIGGVINFVLRRDFHGVEVNANWFATDQGGGDNGRVNVTAGTGSLAKDKYNFFVSADYFKQDQLLGSQRDYTRTAYLPGVGINGTSNRSFPANITQTDPRTGVYGFKGIFNPTIPFPGGATPQSCAPPNSFPTATKPYQCGFDFAPLVQTVPESEKLNVIGRMTWELDANNQFFVEGAYYEGKFKQAIAPTPVSSDFALVPMRLPPTSPYYPGSFVGGLPGGDPTQPLELDYRLLELGPRKEQTDVSQWNAVVGLQGAFRDWDYTIAATYTTNQQATDFVSGFVYGTKFGALLGTGVVNPFGTNTEATLALMRATQATGQINDNRATNYGVEWSLANTVYQLPAGQVALAFGGEARRESLEQTNADFIIGGDIVGGFGAVPSLASAQRTVLSLFGELNIPIVKTLEANVAVRYDHYSDFGSTTNPKFTLRWQPANSVVVRGAYGTGFRAPTLSDLYQPQVIELDRSGFYNDPIRCPVTDAFADCEAAIKLKTGGNPLLQPEKSRQANAGVVLQPTRDLSLSADYYWVTVNNIIDGVPLDAILGTDYATWGPSYVVRKPPDAQYPNLPGQIEYVVQYPTNVGTITTSGIDVNVQWNGPETPVGRFSVGLNGTYVIDFSQSGFTQDDFPTAVGARGSFGVIARYRQYAQLNWTNGPWGATLANTYQSGYLEGCSFTDPTGCDSRRVGPYTVWDLQGRYTGITNLTLTLGIRNALDAPPPLTTATSVGIDPSYADPRGRMFYGALRYVFK